MWAGRVVLYAECVSDTCYCLHSQELRVLADDDYSHKDWKPSRLTSRGGWIKRASSKLIALLSNWQEAHLTSIWSRPRCQFFTFTLQHHHHWSTTSTSLWRWLHRHRYNLLWSCIRGYSYVSVRRGHFCEIYILIKHWERAIQCKNSKKMEKK